MKDDLKKKESQGCLITAGIVFGLTALNPLLTLIFGGDPTNMKAVDINTGELYDVIDSLRMAFFGLLIALVYYIWVHFFRER